VIVTLYTSDAFSMPPPEEPLPLTLLLLMVVAMSLVLGGLPLWSPS